MRYAAGILIVVLAGSGAYAADGAAPDPITQIAPIAPIDAAQGLAVRGYDPVAYFADGQARPGSPRIEWRWQGVRWRFTSLAHRRAFEADPARYAPQFGGYCALAVSLGRVAEGDPAQWAVVDGKLFLNNNARAKAAWDEDRSGNIARADRNWPRIPKLARPAGSPGTAR
ncbi:MAG: YHS domain protein [Proteobacteria bacterium]|nr:YHS domain protein [Pseudomonadota bacterium]